MKPIEEIIEEAGLFEDHAAEIVSLIRNTPGVPAIFAHITQIANEKAAEFLRVDLHDVVDAARKQGEIKGLADLLTRFQMILNNSENPTKETDDEVSEES